MKIILIGGTMESKFALDYVADQIIKLYPQAEVSTYSYSFAIHHIADMRTIIKNHTLMTHSSGAMIIEKSIRPARCIFIAPSRPLPRKRMVWRAAVKTFYHSWKILGFKNKKKILRILLSNVSELLLHPVANLKPFIRGQVSAFDLEDFLARSPHARSSRIVISTRDEMFTQTENDFSALEKKGVNIRYIDAMHDEIFIDTQKVVRAALED